MDDRTKRVLRSTNRFWFQFIQFDEFRLFFARPKMIPNIVQHFLRLYGDKPLGISLQKIVTGRAEEYPVHQLALLTNLTSLQFDFSEGFSTVKERTSLTSLTKLVCLSHMELTSSLTNLTTLTVYPSSLALLPLYANLRSLVLKTDEQSVNPFAVIGSPSKLTKLEVRASHLLWPDVSDILMPQFGNLKSLLIWANGHLPRFLQYLTCLEKLDLCYCMPQDDLFMMTRVTELRLRAVYGEQFDYNKLSALKNIKSLSMNARDDDYIFLQSMTALEWFETTASEQSIDTLKHINSEKLTYLIILEVNEGFNLDHLSNLTTLLELCLHETIFPIPKCYASFSSLTNLTCLFLSTQNASSVQLTVLGSLTNLRQLWLFSYADVTTETSDQLTLKNLTNLDSLFFVLTPSQNTFNDLCHLTRLTRLELNLPTNVFQNNPSALNSMLSLKELIIENIEQSVPQQLWNWVTSLSDLEHLDVPGVNSEEVIESLSILTNLTQLRMPHSDSVKGVHLTKLKNLQILYLDSLVAKQYHENDEFDITEQLTRLVSVTLS